MTPCASPADDRVMVVVKLIEEEGDIGRIVLKITIERNDNVTLCVLESCRIRGRLPTMRSKVDRDDPLVLTRHLVHSLGATISAPVIDED